jgi:tetratricopeptide (TPR) repeat protein
MKARPASVLLVLVLGTLFAGGCGKVQAKAAYQDGNKLYREENFKRAVERYEAAIHHDPNMVEAYFYLGSSHQALHRPGKEGAENKAHLDAATANYKKVLELSGSNPEMAKRVKANALGALVGIYSEEPNRDFETARGYAEQLVKDNPNDVRNLYAMANLYEKFGHVDEAEAAYKKAADLNLNDPKACSALAGFYNKPLWDGKARFEEAVTTLERCASLAPNDPGGWQKVSAFYWDKAYRDPLLDDKKKEEYAEKGLEAVNKALQIKADYFEAVIYKGLLYRVKATIAKNPAERMKYLNEAQELQKQGLELKKQQEQEAAQQAAAKSPAKS